LLLHDGIHVVLNDSIQSLSTVWLNGQTLGQHASGYTSQTYIIPPQLLLPRNNVLVVKADATQPDGWWYDGGGIYRHVSLAIISTPGPYFPVGALYTPAAVVGPVSWPDDAPSAAADFMFQATVANPSSSAFQLQVYGPPLAAARIRMCVLLSNTLLMLFELFDPSGRSVAAVASSISIIQPNATATVAAANASLTAQLWHPQDSNGRIVAVPALWAAFAPHSPNSSDTLTIISPPLSPPSPVTLSARA
jgi:hypothetical protein